VSLKLFTSFADVSPVSQSYWLLLPVLCGISSAAHASACGLARPRVALTRVLVIAADVVLPCATQTAVRLILPGELAKHAVSEGTKAVTKFTST